MKKLSECPICHKSTNIGYACGEYFAYCSSNCPSPACFHPSENTTICSWEDWVEWYCRAQQEQSNKQNYSYLDCLIRNPYVEGCEDCQNGKPPQEQNEPLTLEELRKMKGTPIFVIEKLCPEESGWRIIKSFCHDEGIGEIVLLGDFDYNELNYYGKTWLAYRRKPEKEG